MARNTILIIDDEKEITDILAALFQEEYDIQVFNGGRVAMEYLTKNYKNVAIILCDMVMPDITPSKGYIKTDPYHHDE